MRQHIIKITINALINTWHTSLTSFGSCLRSTCGRSPFFHFILFHFYGQTNHTQGKTTWNIIFFPTPPLSAWFRPSFVCYIIVKWEENLINFIWSEVQEQKKMRKYSMGFSVSSESGQHTCVPRVWAKPTARLLTDAAGALPTRQSKNATETKWKIA